MVEHVQTREGAVYNLSSFVLIFSMRFSAHSDTQPRDHEGVERASIRGQGGKGLEASDYG